LGLCNLQIVLQWPTRLSADVTPAALWKRLVPVWRRVRRPCPCSPAAGPGETGAPRFAYQLPIWFSYSLKLLW